MVRDRPELGERLVPGLPYLKAEAVYAVRYEMALTLEDVLSRRTRALLLDTAATAGAAPSVAELVGAELGWTNEERSRQIEPPWVWWAAAAGPTRPRKRSSPGSWLPGAGRRRLMVDSHGGAGSRISAASDPTRPAAPTPDPFPVPLPDGPPAPADRPRRGMRRVDPPFSRHGRPSRPGG